MEQLLIDTAHAAHQLFKGKPIRVWFVMQEEKHWKCIVINTINKVRLMEGPLRSSPKSALHSAKAQLESAIRKTS